MHATSRSLLGGALAAAATSLAPNLAQGQAATPEPGVAPVPGFGIYRIRVHTSAEIAQAVYPDVLTRMWPGTAAIPGYAGYIFAFDNADPATTINITLTADQAAAESANAVAREFVESMDPRLAPETPIAEEGAVPVYQLGAKSGSELPPLLHGCSVSFRYRNNAPDADMAAYTTTLSEGLVPLLAAMDGFVLYCWILSESSRVAVNIWETEAQAEAGNAAAAEWAAENSSVATVGEPVIHSGTIAWSDILA
jgi:hypothetical protein